MYIDFLWWDPAAAAMGIPPAPVDISWDATRCSRGYIMGCHGVPTRHLAGLPMGLRDIIAGYRVRFRAFLFPQCPTGSLVSPPVLQRYSGGLSREVRPFILDDSHDEPPGTPRWSSRTHGISRHPDRDPTIDHGGYCWGGGRRL